MNYNVQYNKRLTILKFETQNLNNMEEVNKNTELNNTDKKLHISDVRYSYEDVEEFCRKNGYYIGEYWFPYRNKI